MNVSQRNEDIMDDFHQNKQFENTSLDYSELDKRSIGIALFLIQQKDGNEKT